MPGSSSRRRPVRDDAATRPHLGPARTDSRGESAGPAPAADLDRRDVLLPARRVVSDDLPAPFVVWDNLSTHRTAGLRDYAAGHDWLTTVHLPSYSPDLNLVEGSGPCYRRPELIHGCLTEAGLTLSPGTRS
ncbi:transposase [Streptomyces sp. NPDC006365]|uniref:transposase n=1 Tax=Streptomyces sp. NPDC006365 TaxID=3364744 RepID=UPI0036CE135A